MVEGLGRIVWVVLMSFFCSININEEDSLKRFAAEFTKCPAGATETLTIACLRQ
jgi:hypothetical protein